MGGGASNQSHTCLSRLWNWPSLRSHELQRGNGFREMASLPIPDDLVAEIFLLLPTPADLVRASAACVSFRRVAVGRSFLRRFRELHARPLLGFFDQNKVFYPAIAPHPSASAASAVALAADFSFYFLPAPGSAPSSRWFVLDIRDGRVLLDNGTDSFSGMVVCGPLHQQHLLLPPITCDLTASVDDPLWRKLRRIETFLVPPGDEAAAAEETSFRVMWMANSKTRLVAFLFSSNTGQWRVISSRRCSDLTAGFRPYGFSLRQYVYGCFYWYWVTAECEGCKLLVLDTQTMEFSFAKLPLEVSSCRDLAMVEAGEGRPGLFVLADSRYDLSYFIRRNNGGSSSQWQKVKTISLGYWSRLICNMEKHLLLHKEQSLLLEAGCFTLDIETFQLERVCALEYTFDNFHKLHAYSNFPPSLLSSPTISIGVENMAEKEMLEEACAASSSAESHGQGSADTNAEDQKADWRCW